MTFQKKHIFILFLLIWLVFICVFSFLILKFWAMGTQYSSTVRYQDNSATTFQNLLDKLEHPPSQQKLIQIFVNDLYCGSIKRGQSSFALCDSDGNLISNKTKTAYAEITSDKLLQRCKENEVRLLEHVTNGYIFDEYESVSPLEITRYRYATLESGNDILYFCSLYTYCPLELVWQYIILIAALSLIPLIVVSSGKRFC